MSQWTNYWKIITPQKAKTSYTMTDSSSSSPILSNYSWYNQLMKGAGSRLQRYSQYNAMDSDVDVSRALDIIAEEMSIKNTKTNLPFIVEYQNEENKEVDEGIVTTLRASVRHWSDIHDFDNKIFQISRNVTKFGDCFFRKTSDHKPWIHINPADVIGLEINENNEIIAYHLRKNDNKTRSYVTYIVPAAAMIHFSLSDNMTDDGPFGESILNPVVKAYKQLGLLEDSVIIYRIVRAPERRVFYIDTGNMPAHKQKQYLETVKNEIRQKRIPNSQDGTDKVDSIYNPNSISEDFFFANTANGRGSRVETLPSGENLGEIEDLSYFKEKFFRGLRVPNSYMRGSDKGGAQANDGKVGIAYIEELRFANFIQRLQGKIEKVFDNEFKTYLKVAGINIDKNLFKLRLPEPQNFALYKQAAVDADLVNTFNTIEQLPYMSKRYILKRYLGWTEDDVQMNESMLRQEHNIPENQYGDELPDLQQFYDPQFYENRPDIEVPSKEKKSDEVPSEEPSDKKDLDLEFEPESPELEEPKPEEPEIAAGKGKPEEEPGIL